MTALLETNGKSVIYRSAIILIQFSVMLFNTNVKENYL